MKHYFYKLFLIGITLFSSFSFAQDEVPYQIAEKYFVKNTFPDGKLQVLKINSQDKFAEIFGMATTMGANGKPTTIDFSTSFVIAIVDGVSKDTESITINSLKKEKGKLNLTYTVSKKDDLSTSYNRRFATLLVVNNDYNFELNSTQMKNQESMPILGGDSDEFGCKPSTGYTWSVLENKCIAPFETKYVLEGKDINSMGNAALVFNAKNDKAEIIGFTKSPNFILTKKGKAKFWSNGTYKLVPLKNKQYIFKQNDNTIATSQLRK